MKRNYKYIVLGLAFIGVLIGCKVENLKEYLEVPKSDYSTFNYVLATEDASDVDITTFFAFTMNGLDTTQTYDLLNKGDQFINSNPSTSSGHVSMHQYFYSLAKDKKGYSSTPGLFRMGLNDKNRVYIQDNLSISKNNLFPARQLCIVNDGLGYFYDEGTDAQKIKIFNPTTMVLKGKIDLRPAIESFKSNIKWVDASGNNLVRTGSLILASKENKLYVSIVFLEKAGFNLVPSTEENVYLAVVDMTTNQVEKIISYAGAKTIGFFVTENKASVLGDDGHLYFCSWGWNQFNEGNPSQIFRIKAGETDFDTTWKIDIESLFGPGRIAQSIGFYNGKLYAHISNQSYTFEDSQNSAGISMSYYSFDPSAPQTPIALPIPSSNTSDRMNVFSNLDNKLMIAVPNNNTSKFNGYYSINANGSVEKVMRIANKYRPTRMYKLQP